MPITASQLYSHFMCPHRVTMDAFGDPAQREAPNAFVQLLWERGSLFEIKTIEGLGVPFTDLSTLRANDKESATRDAIARGDALIYAGRLSVDGLLGEPDLLRRHAIDAQGHALYVAIDIKSGAGKEGRGDDEDGDGKPKKHYAVQLALYTDILIRLDRSAGRFAFIWDIHGREVVYDFDAALGTRSSDTLWSIYLQAHKAVEIALQRSNSTRAALSAMCKVCVWRTACLTTLERAQDLTLLPDLGRKRRDTLARAFPTLADLAGANIDQHVHGRKTDFAGVGVDMLRKFQARAWLATSPHPMAYLKKPIVLPHSDAELFFDLETDPMRDLCYLHGIVIREHRDPATERFYAFFAEGDMPEAERDAFAAAWALLSARADAAIYIYSTYERTVYRQLAQKYPDVCSGAAVEALFASARLVDLYYDVVLPDTEWPTRDFSIKSIAKYLGFSWRDSNPSGAASIEWFDHYMQTRDTKDRQRILDYNEDDCVAMRVLVDALRGLPVRLT